MKELFRIIAGTIPYNLFFKLLLSPSFTHALLDYSQSMDFLGGSSRVWSVENLFQSTLSQVVVVPGGKLRVITQALCDLIDKYEPVWRQTHPTHPNIAYVVGGIPDITTRLQGNGWGPRYEEVVMDTEVGTTLDYMNAELRSSEKLLKEKGVVPIFATVATMDIETWNKHRMTKRKTSCLLYKDRYCNMQMDLNEAIFGVNDIIRQINAENDVKGPEFSRYIMTPREGCTDRETKFKIRTGPAKFTDGCHPSPSLSAEWSFHLTSVQQENRSKVSTLNSLGAVHVPSRLSVWPDIHKYANHSLTLVRRRR